MLKLYIFRYTYYTLPAIVIIQYYKTFIMSSITIRLYIEYQMMLLYQDGLWKKQLLDKT